jgi:ferredoxin
MKKTGPTMMFQPSGKVVEIRDFESVLEVALSGGVPLEHSCGGMGTCTSCRVFVVGDLQLAGERTELEIEMAESRGFTPDERLGCQLKPYAGLVVRLPKKRS